MIVTVTLNPALDYLIPLDQVHPGTIHRFSRGTFAPGGKGVNVSLLLTSLGVENRALGLAAGFSGKEICRLLEEQGCTVDFVHMETGYSRINVKLRCPTGQETDFNGEGPEIPGPAVDALVEKLQALQPEGFLVLAGSLPQGLPETAWPRLLETCRRRGSFPKREVPRRPGNLRPSHQGPAGSGGPPSCGCSPRRAATGCGSPTGGEDSRGPAGPQPAPHEAGAHRQPCQILYYSGCGAGVCPVLSPV